MAAALLATPVPATATPHHPGSHNPVSAGAADTFADPAVIRGPDGFWYAYDASDPPFAGQTEPRLIPILRSRDLFDWTYVGDVFTPATRPSWATPTAGLWAPDIRYAAGRYVLYFTVTDTTLNEGDDSAIGVATAPTPTGPWTPTGRAERRPAPSAGLAVSGDVRPGRAHRCAGPPVALLRLVLLAGIFTVPLSADGLSVAGAPTQVTIDNATRGVRRAARPLVLPVRVGRELLRRPDDRLQRVRRPLHLADRAVRRPRRSLPC